MRVKSGEMGEIVWRVKSREMRRGILWSVKSCEIGEIVSTVKSGEMGRGYYGGWNLVKVRVWGIMASSLAKSLINKLVLCFP